METLRAAGLQDLLNLMARLGYSTDGIETKTQALTRLSGLVYAAEV